MRENGRRPGTVMFVAILLFVFAAVYIMSGCYNAGLAIYAATAPEPAPNAKVQFDDSVAMTRFLIDEIPGFIGVQIGLSFLDIFFGIAQFVCGLGVLRLRPNARTLTIGLIVTRLLYALAVDLFSGFVQAPAILRFIELHPPEMPPEAGVQAVNVLPFVQIFVIAAIGVEVAVQVFVAVLLLLLLRTESVKAAFAGTPPGDAPTELPTVAPTKPAASPYSGYEDDEPQHV